jgi:hypothetical protein
VARRQAGKFPFEDLRDSVLAHRFTAQENRSALTRLSPDDPRLPRAVVALDLAMELVTEDHSFLTSLTQWASQAEGRSQPATVALAAINALRVSSPKEEFWTAFENVLDSTSYTEEA